MWLALRTVEKFGGRCAESEALPYARRSGLRGGGLPTGEGFTLAVQGGFLSKTGGEFELSLLGHRVLALGIEDDPPPEAIKLLISVLILALPPMWVAWWQGAPDDLARVIPPAERQVLEEVELLPVSDTSKLGVWAWWDALKTVPATHHDDRMRKVVGDAGEELSVAFERSRLESEGRADLAQRVSWLAQKSDAYGFDILSFAGPSHPELPADEALAIEVKSTVLPLSSSFGFFLSQHEWQTAAKLAERYIFHLWSAVSPGPPATSHARAPVVVPAGKLTGHLPGAAGCGDSCAWETAHLHLPLPEAVPLG
jgi:uncharacterized protein DUF3883